MAEAPEITLEEAALASAWEAAMLNLPRQGEARAPINGRGLQAAIRAYLTAQSQTLASMTTVFGSERAGRLAAEARCDLQREDIMRLGAELGRATERAESAEARATEYRTALRLNAIRWGASSDEVDAFINRTEASGSAPDAASQGDR